jgi:alkylhydroperoxidase family enzyme
MARVPYTDAPEGLPPYHIFQAMAHAPKLLDGYSKLGGRLLFRGTLDPRVRELVINAMSAKLDAPYEWSHHVGMARGVGVTDDELRAVRDGKLHELGPLERTCVEYAHKVEDRTVTDADVDGLRGAGLSNEQIVELSILAGFYGLTARVLLALDVEIDEGNPDFSQP